ncbi:MAG: nuclear transport factor 2 family protein [Pseudomonadota bacterium]
MAKMLTAGLLAMLACAVGPIFSTAMANEDVAAPQWTPEEQAVIDAVSNGPIGIEDDFDAWASGFTDTWSYWRIGAAEIRERDAHMRRVKDYIDGGARVVAYEMTPVDVVVRGTAALLRLNATETIEEAGGETVVVQYSSAAFLIKEGGVWRIEASNLFYPPSDDE